MSMRINRDPAGTPPRFDWQRRSQGAKTGVRAFDDRDPVEEDTPHDCPDCQDTGVSGGGEDCRCADRHLRAYRARRDTARRLYPAHFRSELYLLSPANVAGLHAALSEEPAMERAAAFLDSVGANICSEVLSLDDVGIGLCWCNAVAEQEIALKEADAIEKMTDEHEPEEVTP